jgi:hypothetical protein
MEMYLRGVASDTSRVIRQASARLLLVSRRTGNPENPPKIAHPRGRQQSHQPNQRPDGKWIASTMGSRSLALRGLPAWPPNFCRGAAFLQAVGASTLAASTGSPGRGGLCEESERDARPSSDMG